FVFVRPGGVAAVLWGLLNTVLSVGLERPSSLPVDGLDQVLEAIAPFSAEAMAPLCVVEAQVIRQLARDFAAADKAVCYG
ncbi:molybdopterin oxidoreductase family protein, partial [Pseudomonas sp. BJa5]|nr:molybdopterin oxidoreductase family protein [Pseudomonas sp. BGr12]